MFKTRNKSHQNEFPSKILYRGRETETEIEIKLEKLKYSLGAHSKAHISSIRESSCLISTSLAEKRFPCKRKTPHKGGVRQLAQIRRGGAQQ